MLDLTIFEIALLGLILVAAGVNFYLGRDNGIELGMRGALEYLVNDGTISRFINKEGDIDFCSRGVMNNICPKCGFSEGDAFDE